MRGCTCTIRADIFGWGFRECACTNFTQFFEKKRFQRKTKGGENSGEGKTYHKTPPQKWFWTPPTYATISPPFVHAIMSFSLVETGTGQLHKPTSTGIASNSTFAKVNLHSAPKDEPSVERMPPPYVLLPPPPFANSQPYLNRFRINLVMFWSLMVWGFRVSFFDFPDFPGLSFSSFPAYKNTRTKDVSGLE